MLAIRNTGRRSSSRVQRKETNFGISSADIRFPSRGRRTTFRSANGDYSGCVRGTTNRFSWRNGGVVLAFPVARCRPTTGKESWSSEISRHARTNRKSTGSSIDFAGSNWRTILLSIGKVNCTPSYAKSNRAFLSCWKMYILPVALKFTMHGKV